MPKNRIVLGAEFPHSDMLQLVVLIPSFIVWRFDSFIYQFSTFLAVFVPIAVRLVFAAVSFVLACLLLTLSHRMVYDKARDSPNVLNAGVYGRVRHPMYLGTLVVYMGFVLATFSFLSFAAWIGILLLYDKLATYEEEDLIRLLGDAYRNYQNSVPKWLPRITHQEKV